MLMRLHERTTLRHSALLGTNVFVKIMQINRRDLYDLVKQKGNV